MSVVNGAASAVTFCDAADEERKLKWARSMWASLIENEDNRRLIRNAVGVDNELMMKMLALNINKGNVMPHFIMVVHLDWHFV
jgi:hypothetical protein